MSILSRYITFLFVFISSVLNAQNAFQKTFGGLGKEVGYSIIQTFDHGYIMVGKSNSAGSGMYDEYIIKTDQNGDTLWTKLLGWPYDEIGNFIVQNTDSSYFISGGSNTSDTYLADMFSKIDKNGNVIWTRSLHSSDGFMIGKGIQETADGNYVVAGYGSGTLEGEGFSLSKMDPLGTVLWSNLYGISNAMSGNVITTTSMVQARDGGFVMLGQGNDFTDGYLDIYLIKTDASGNMLWQHAYSGGINDTANSIQATADGGYIITGSTNSFDSVNTDAYLIKADSVGNITWAKTYGGLNEDDGLSVKQANDGGYVFVGNTADSLGRFDVFLAKTDNTGNLLWTKSYGGINSDYGYSVAQTIDNGFVITGTTNSYGAGDDDLFFIKTDSTGYSGCNENTIKFLSNTVMFNVSNSSLYNYPGDLNGSSMSLGISASYSTVSNLCYIEGINESAAIENYLNLYPNPVTDQVTIEFTLTDTKYNTIEIKNVLGQTVKRIDANFSTPKNQLQINTSDLSKGIYFIELQNGDRLLSKKFIRQ